MKPGATIMLGIILVIGIAAVTLLPTEHHASLLTKVREAPTYVMKGDFVEYDGGIICKVLTQVPYDEYCPPSAPEPNDRVFKRAYDEIATRDNDIFAKYVAQFTQPK